MKKNYLKIACGLLAINSAQATTFNKLEFEADNFCEKIWRGIPVTQEMLDNSLNFIKRKELTHDTPDYTKETFLNLVKGARKLKGMEGFCDLCQAVYERTSDVDKRSALHILMKRVEILYRKNIKLSEKLQKAVTCNTEASFQEDLNLFFNADRDFIAH